MGKYSWGITAILVCSLVGLTGCATETVKEEESKPEETEQLEEENPIEIVQIDEPAAVPVHVNVIEPNTNEVLRTIVPEVLGFGTEDEKYKNELADWASKLARGTESEPGYDQRNIPDRLDENGNIIKGRPTVVLEEAELVESILNASEEGGDVELPLYVTESKYKEEDVAKLSEVVVASYTTYFNRNVTGRNKNIELSAKAIDNVILGVGDHFSFNDTVGPSDAEHGYQPAQEIVNKKLVMGIGGGICQTSSTLFNAVDKIGVDYVEWHHHSLSVGYVPEGRDATVSYGGKDFRFLNTTGVPILLNAKYGDGTLTVEVSTSKEYAEVMKQSV
ncbi:VanW family protein [Mesobacillus maritimus]|uniref:VanW family protein n=1 Tax=Mesobacillus maritimus TaxID=1643336 RepID=UPI00384D8BF6